MAQYVFLGGKSKQCMGNAAVADIDAWGFNEAFADIGMPWLQSTNEQQIDH